MKMDVLKPKSGCYFVVVFILLLASFDFAFGQDGPVDSQWQPRFKMESPRPNPFQLDPVAFQSARNWGQWHAQYYPVSVTGVLPPLKPIKKILDNDFRNPLVKWVQSLLRAPKILQSFDALMQWLGLNEYPAAKDTGIYKVFIPETAHIDHRFGMGSFERYGSTGFTMSCALCHSSSLFGKTVLGLTNRFPRANEFFLRASKILSVTPPKFFEVYSASTFGEMKLFTDSQNSMRSVGAVAPLVLGLDTSLAQVALSLQKRNPDSWATKNTLYEFKPRLDYLDHIPADSKPAVWWNVKYKNRWLSDGSVISGNPILTNILWNEIGRGTDLNALNNWIVKNGQVIQELTTAVFSSESPRITDFFDESKIDLAKAKRGEVLFLENCATCHGLYHKNWSLPEMLGASVAEQIKTYRVEYKKLTAVKNVGTDPYRYLGMKSLEKLNALQISKNNGIVIESQTGYVPPPLVGIWSRWPYLHNNSIPSLCELLTPAEFRKKEFFQGPAVSATDDFDFECNGYPEPDRAPQTWKQNPELKYDTQKKGMGNMGHDENIFLVDGQEIFSSNDKKDLIHFLQTL